MDRSAIYCSPLAIFCPHQIHLWSLRAIGRVSDSRLYPLKLSSYRPCLRAGLLDLIFEQPEPDRAKSAGVIPNPFYGLLTSWVTPQILICVFDSGTVHAGSQAC